MVTPIAMALFPTSSELKPESEDHELKGLFNLSMKYSSLLVLILSNLAFTLYGLILAREKFKVSVDLGGKLRIYLSSALPTIAFLQLSPLTSLPNLMIGAAIYLLAYLTLTPALKAIDKHGVENLKQIFEKMRVVWPLFKLAINYESKLLNKLSGSHG